jgi:hypothetical protein
MALLEKEALCNNWRGAQRTAEWLAGATRTNGSGLADSDFWYQAFAKLLKPHLFAAATSGRTMTDVVRWVNTQEEKEVREALQAAAVPEAINAATASWKRESRQKSSVYTTVETVLNAYEDPVVSRSAMSSDISPEVQLDGTPRTLYVVSPSHEQRRLRPLFETLLQTVINYAFELSGRTGKPLDPPLLVVLDEAANIAPLRDLDTLASTAASHGIQLVSVFQDLAQISTRYGERSQTVVNNHRAKIVLSGISDTQTLENASRLLGDEESCSLRLLGARRGRARQPSQWLCGASLLRTSCDQSVRGKGYWSTSICPRLAFGAAMVQREVLHAVLAHETICPRAHPRAGPVVADSVHGRAHRNRGRSCYEIHSVVGVRLACA